MARSGFRRDPRGVRGLMERGFSDEDILKILGGDTLRVMRDVEQISRQLKTEAAGGGRK
jgi:membrane dipeptidase